MQLPHPLNELVLADPTDRITQAIATGNHAVVGQVMAYEMLMRCKEYPPDDIAHATFIASNVAEWIQGFIPGSAVYVESQETEAPPSEKDGSA